MEKTAAVRSRTSEMKIGGTVSNPEGSLDVAASAVSILGDDKNLKAISGLLGGGTSSSEPPKSEEPQNSAPKSTAGDLINTLGNFLNKK